MIKIDDFNYHLPADLIAKEPTTPRDHSRFLVFSGGKIQHDYFYNLGRYLTAGDLLVVNSSRVIPARLLGLKSSGGKVEILLLKQIGGHWLALIGGKIDTGDKIIFSKLLTGTVLEKKGKEAEIKFNLTEKKFWAKINIIGKTPIPPYIKDTKLSESELKKEYQTIYARNYGSVAAPTAGLHFSEKLMGELKSAGIGFSEVNLHVGLGTFAPLTVENIKQKKLHSEKFSIPHSTIKKILEAKKTKNRIIAVGTTTVRALETSASKILNSNFSQLNSISGSTEIFIQPGDKFQITDGLITNYHLPCSSLMMLVAAFLEHKGSKDGRKKLLELYKTAIAKHYRFYSFGDAMLII